MIRLMGQEVRDEEIPTATSPSSTSACATGEKLYEELLIGENITPTEHPRIMRSQEPLLPKSRPGGLLRGLRETMEERLQYDTIRAALARAVESYRPERGDSTLPCRAKPLERRGGGVFDSAFARLVTVRL